MKEIWMPIKGYENLYEVSNLGRVRSLGRTIHGKARNGTDADRFYKGKTLTPQGDRNGYLHVGLMKDGVVKIYRIHRLVAQAFIENPDNLPEVNHIDEDRTNNKMDNLEWCTHQYNNSYGNKPAKGEKNGMARLTSEQITDIRERRKSGEMLKTIAADYGISINHVCNIAKGKRWSHEVFAG